MEITNNFNHTITPSLQKKIDNLTKYYEGNKRVKLIQAYISKGGYLVVDSEHFSRVDNSTYYIRSFFGPRGGFNEKRYYREYDFTDNEPYSHITTER